MGECTLSLDCFYDLQLQRFVFLGDLGTLRFGSGDPVFETDHGIPIGAGYDFVAVDRSHSGEYLMQDIGNQLVQNVHGIAGLTGAVSSLSGLVVADITVPSAANLFTCGIDTGRAVGGDRQSCTAVTAEHIARQ